MSSATSRRRDEGELLFGVSRTFRCPRGAHALTASAASRRPRTSQDEQVAGDDPESDPTFHPGLASISTSAETLTALHGTDAAFAPGAPPQPSAIPALAGRGRPSACRPAPAGEGHRLAPPGPPAALV